ncbi:uracil-DNA glycosylase-like [Octopus sinensis]|uniref:Uracil-DNA glycosylase-like n=1 Tax=Octopus sinensis TaxID=2607531 RepID=A0A6P7TWP7_9MOLL|nr:uracil-DNA glycosylase-like [Octopus sinensis]
MADLRSEAKLVDGIDGYRYLGVLEDRSAILKSKLSEYIKQERLNNTIFPSPENVFSFTRFCPINDVISHTTLNKVKVVILGQDPYHGIGQPWMSRELGKARYPLSKNVGVLLLNAVLTVRSSQPNSHKGRGWEEFTDSVVEWLNKKTNNVVFMLWGSYAQKKGSHIDKV